MRHYLGELLESLEREYPKQLTVGSLRQKIGDDVDGAIREAVSRELITYPTYNPNGAALGTGDRVYLSIQGFEVLNQIKIRESIDDFNESANKSSNQLIDSIRKFSEASDKSAKIMESYTARLVNLTWLLLIFTIILLVIPPETPQSEKFLGIIFIVIVALIIFQLKKN